MKRSFVTLVLLLNTWVVLFSQQEARLLRFPTIHGDKIVFSYAGDLYSVGSRGGVARKLTSDVGYEMFARFSQVGGEKGSADSERDPRGFALKFYTEDGNWDLVGNNTPVFFIIDPKKFSHFIHTQ